MLKKLSILVLTIATVICHAKTPIEKYGPLRVEGTHIVSQKGEPVQLKGLATHGLQWYKSFYEDGKVIKSAAKEWGADVIRLSVYVYEGGYLDNKTMTPEDFDKVIDKMVKDCIKNGLYCILDWHIHYPGDPSLYTDDAKKFFAKMSKRYAKYPNMIYEIANEPNHLDKHGKPNGKMITWSDVKSYAEEVIPVIRKNAPNSIVIVGSPAWSTLGVSMGGNWRDVADNRLEFNNIVYTIHFYASGHQFYKPIIEAAQVLPLFATEWAAATWEPNSTNDLQKAKPWLDMLKEYKISWTYWCHSPGGNALTTFNKDVKSTDDLSPTGPNVNDTGKLVYKLLSE